MTHTRYYVKPAPPILIALLAALLLLPSLATAAAERSRGGRQLTLGQLSEDGTRVRLNLNRLSRRMGRGVRVDGFVVLRRGEDYMLVRAGKHEGRTVTEGIALERAGRDLRVFGELKWIVTCAPSECDGFCLPAENRCECVGESTAIGELYVPGGGGWGDVEQRADDGDLSPGAGDGCTFGTRGGGAQDVLVLN